MSTIVGTASAVQYTTFNRDCSPEGEATGK